MYTKHEHEQQPPTASRSNSAYIYLYRANTKVVKTFGDFLSCIFRKLVLFLDRLATENIETSQTRGTHSIKNCMINGTLTY